MEARVAVAAGDGIGIEVMPEALRVLAEIQSRCGHTFTYEEALVGGCAIDAGGKALPDEALALFDDVGVVLFGACGGPKWDHVPADERPERALATIRKEFDLFVNLRPVRARKSLAPVLPFKERIIGDGLDFVVVRELAGGIYYGEPHGIEEGPDGRRGYNTMTYSEREIERVLRVAYELARGRRGHVTSVDKANMIEVSRVWRDVAERVAEEYTDVETNHLLIDACALAMVMRPEQFDVLVTGNLFGDILTDEAGALAGSLGMLPSASYGDGRHALYEPIHGTAPDIAGQNLANPLGMILTAAMMLRHSFDVTDEAQAIDDAVDKALEDGFRTGDIRQEGLDVIGTRAMTDAVIARLDV
ncbi:MAG: 3-isopropylmalate dehydrogenase [Candidatus Poribacteria bacterium]